MRFRNGKDLSIRKAALLNIRPSTITKRGELRIVLDAFCKEAGLPTDLVLSRASTWPVVNVRNAFIRYLRETHNMSYPQIGNLVGRDHSTVMHSLRLLPAKNSRYIKKRRKNPVDQVVELTNK
jgi:chromosomal replication initiation ATPase DnaA